MPFIATSHPMSLEDPETGTPSEVIGSSDQAATLIAHCEKLIAQADFDAVRTVEFEDGSVGIQGAWASGDAVQEDDFSTYYVVEEVPTV